MSIKIIYEVEDADGDKGTTEVKVQDGITIAGLNGFGAGYATALNNMIGGIIRSAAAFIKANLSGLIGNALSNNADVEHIGKFVFLTENGLRVRVNIPCWNELSMLTTTSDAINQATPAVAAFIAAMEDGISVGGALITPCDIGEEDVTDVVFAREAFRNSGARA